MIHSDLFGNPYIVPIQALTWKRPFAALMLHGKIETREWNTLYRGPVLICAGKSEYSATELADLCTPEQIQIIEKIKKNDPYFSYIGVAVAVGHLYDSRIMQRSDEEKCFVRFSDKLFVHLYKNVKRIEPIKFIGSMKWSSVSDQRFLKKIKYV